MRTAAGQGQAGSGSGPEGGAGQAAEEPALGDEPPDEPELFSEEEADEEDADEDEDDVEEDEDALPDEEPRLSFR